MHLLAVQWSSFCVCLFVRDEDDGEFSRTQQILDELGVIKPTLIVDCQRVQEICRVISERAAFLASAGILLFINFCMNLYSTNSDT